MAAARKGKKLPEVRVRMWTDEELKQLAIVLADDVNEYDLTLETLALKSRLTRNWMHDYTNSKTKEKRTAPHGKERQNQSKHPLQSGRSNI